MQFNVSLLLKEPTGSTREYGIEDDIAIDGATHRVIGSVRLDRTPRGVLVRADVHGAMDDVCSRCVKPIAYPIDIDIAEEYIPTLDAASGAAIEAVEGEEDAYRIDARHMLDLAEAVAQYWTLEVPMAPVCDDDCRGLCPICGEEIAAVGHACSGEEIDTRWSALAKLQLG